MRGGKYSNTTLVWRTDDCMHALTFWPVDSVSELTKAKIKASLASILLRIPKGRMFLHQNKKYFKLQCVWFLILNCRRFSELIFDWCWVYLQTFVCSINWSRCQNWLIVSVSQRDTFVGPRKKFSHSIMWSISLTTIVVSAWNSMYQWAFYGLQIS